MKTILVTGGCGFIASHFISVLDANACKVIVVDNLCNSDRQVIDNLKKITAIEIDFHEVDLRDIESLKRVFKSRSIDLVVHFAGLKSVADSVIDPISYYENNVVGSLNLLSCMQAHDVNNIIFSSSATVYGHQDQQPISETQPAQPINPYGQTKFAIETILHDVSHSSAGLNAVILRYFNPVGAHPSGFIGESPKGQPNNLMPIILNVAARKVDYVNIFGDDYDTPDGTGLRDYIHVMDLASAHLAAIKQLEQKGVMCLNIGTGSPTSVFELVHAFEKVNNIKIPYKVTKRREADLAVCYADAHLANEKLGWQSRLTIEDACRDAWRAYQNLTSN